MLHLAFSPLVPVPLLIGVAVLSLGLIVLMLIGRRTGALYRVVALGAVVAALANPSLVSEERDRLKDVVAVIVDRSGSQTLDKRAAQTDAVKAEIEKRLAALPGLDIRTADSVDAGDNGTALFATLSSALSDVPPERVAGAIFITDGQVHDIPATAGALGFRAPLHALVTGYPGERDRRIALIDAPRFGIVGKEQVLRLRVLDSGGDGAPMRLVARRDGVQVAERRVRAGEVVRLPILIEHGGPNVVEVEVETAPGELTPINNKTVVSIEGIRDKLRVLLVSGQPHAGERTWRNMLKSDASVDLVHFTILRPPEKQDGTPINELSLIAFPTRELFETKIKDFDLIIFDRYSNQSILPPVYFANIVRYVREGGAVLVAAGPEFQGRSGLASTPLATVLPAQPDGTMTETPFKVRLTGAGHRHPVTRDLPGSEADPPNWGEWLRTVSATVRTGTSVLSGAENKPMLVLSHEGKGRVALLLSDQAWLWAREFHGGGPHLDLLRRLGHWLMKEPDLEEEALRARAAGGQLVIERQTMQDVAARVTLRSPSGKESEASLGQVEPGLWRATVPVGELGLYQVRDGDLIAFASVGPVNPREFNEVVSMTDRLAPVSEASGGSVRRVAQRDGETPRIPTILRIGNGSRFAGQDYIGLRDTQSFVVTGVSVYPVFSDLRGLVALAGALVLAWLGEAGFRRRRARG
jgi:hypothetical protein